MKNYWGAFLCLAAIAQQPVPAQPYTTTYNVPPDTLPSQVGSDTLVNFLDGSIHGLQAGATDGSSTNIQVNVLGGSIGRGFVINGGASVLVDGGDLSSGAEVNDGGRVDLINGYVNDFRSHDGSTVHVDGGTVSSVYAYDGSLVELASGVIGTASLYPGSTLPITGGAIGPIRTEGAGADVQIFGDEFALDGQPITGLNTIGDSIQLDIPDGSVLSGTLPDGRVILLSSNRNDIIAAGTLSLNKSQVPPVGLATINAPADPVPGGLRSGQSLNLGPGATAGDWLRAVDAEIEIDGGSIGENLEIYNSQLTLTDGTIGNSFKALNSSTVNILGGTILSSMTASDGTTVDISGGEVSWYFTALSGANVNISGDAVVRELRARTGSHVSIESGDVNGLDTYLGTNAHISGGHVSGASIYSGSEVYFSGGSLGSLIYGEVIMTGGSIFGCTLRGGGVLTMSGGTIDNHIYVTDGSQINLIGQSFILNGVDITSDLTPGLIHNITDRDVILDAMLSDGSWVSFKLSDTFTSQYGVFTSDSSMTVTLQLPGDLNSDGFVGLDDLDIILPAWNTSVTPGDLLAGDPSGDGYVGLDDLDLVLGNWNVGTPPASVGVPEPSVAGFVMLSMLACCLRCQR